MIDNNATSLDLTTISKWSLMYNYPDCNLEYLPGDFDTEIPVTTHALEIINKYQQSLESEQSEKKRQILLKRKAQQLNIL